METKLEAGLRWFGHVARKDSGYREDSWMQRVGVTEEDTRSRVRFRQMICSGNL